MQDLIARIKGGLDYVTFRQLMNEIYDTTFGLCNHFTETAPLAAIRMHPGEKIHKYSIKGDYIERFFLLNMHTKTGLSIDQFLSRPRYELELLFERAELVDKLRAKTNNDLLSDLQNNPPQ